METVTKTIHKVGSVRRPRRKRIGLITCLVVMACLLLLYSGRNWLVKTVVERVVQQNLGMTVTIDSLQLDPWHGFLAITGLTAYNPPGFESKGAPTTLARIPSIKIQYDLPTFFQKHRLHLTYLELNLYEASIVKNRQGELNLNRIQALANRGAQKATRPPVSGTVKPQELSYRIDQLVLTATQVEYKDYSKTKPKTLRIRLGIYKERFVNLNSLDEVIRVVAARVVVKAGLYNLGLPFRNLTHGVRQTGKTISSGIRKTAAGVDRFFKGVNKK